MTCYNEHNNFRTSKNMEYYIETGLSGRKRYKLHEITTEFGELYDFLIVTDYPEEWDTLVYSQGNRHTAFAYVWNKDDEWCSEFGSVTLQSFGGGIRRIA